MGGPQVIGDVSSKGTVGLYAPYSSSCFWDHDTSDFAPRCAP